VVVEITPLGAQNLGWRFFLIFMVFNAAFVPIIYFLYPETAGKSLEELDGIFYETTKAWRLTDMGSNVIEDDLATGAPGGGGAGKCLDLEKVGGDGKRSRKTSTNESSG
jgi:hypothetical protein